MSAAAHFRREAASAALVALRNAVNAVFSDADHMCRDMNADDALAYFEQHREVIDGKLRDARQAFHRVEAAHQRKGA